MPNYDFRCLKCEHAFTKLVRIDDRINVKCPKCNGDVKQIFTWSGGFIVNSNNSTGNACKSSRFS